MTTTAQGTELQIMSPSDLKIGDIVHAHGMRLLVDQEPQLSKSHPGGKTYRTHTLLLNRDEVSDDHVPYAWTMITTGWPNHTPTGEHRWTIQGNQSARIAVERT